MSATILPFARPPQDALMSLHSKIPDTAMTAELLGTERHAHAVQVTASGLLLTVGYSVMEAAEVWLTNRKGQTTEAIVLAQDYDSGLALLKPGAALGLHHLDTIASAALKPGDALSVLGAGDREAQPVTLHACEEFAGRWEYLLEKAFYTLPLYERWSGAALLDADGRLCGIGSLALGIRTQRNPRAANSEVEPGNLFIPVDLVMPHLDYMQAHGQRPGKLRPWLGTLVEEHNSEIYVVGLYTGAPAARAGLRPGDIILSVDRQPVSTMAGFFRTVWRYGPAGTALPLTVSDGKDTRDVVLDTVDRSSFFLHHAHGFFN
jgi:S1-C subfamily serine protease